MKKGDVVVFNPIKYIPNERIVANLLKVDDTIAKNMTSNFSFVVEGIKRRVLAEITEEFFEKVFPNGHIHSVAEFEDRIRQDARLSFSSETEKKFMNDSIDALVKKYEFPLPVDFMKRWILSTQQKNSNVTKEDLDANFETKYETISGVVNTTSSTAEESAAASQELSGRGIPQVRTSTKVCKITLTI